MFSSTLLAKMIKAFQQELPEVKKITKKKPGLPFLNGRWTIVVLFLLTVLASLFFYFQAEAPGFWQKLTSPAVISTLPDQFNPRPVLDQIKSLTKDLRGKYGVYIYRLGSQVEYGLKQEENFPAASLIKLPVILTLYQEAEKSNLNLDDYREMAEAMGKRSDNIAFNQIVELLGKEKIQQTIDLLDMKKTSFEKNETTPQDTALFFQKLYYGGLVSDEHREEIFSFLTETIYENRIPAGVPEGIQVVHKIGTEIGSFSDAGIIFSERPFILVIISKNARESEANEVLPEITRAIWEFENE